MEEMMSIDNINQKVGSTELRNSMNTFLLLKAALLIPSSTYKLSRSSRRSLKTACSSLFPR